MGQMWHWNNVPMQHPMHGMHPMVLMNSQMAYEGALLNKDNCTTCFSLLLPATTTFLS